MPFLQNSSFWKNIYKKSKIILSKLVEYAKLRIIEWVWAWANYWPLERRKNSWSYQSCSKISKKYHFVQYKRSCFMDNNDCYKLSKIILMKLSRNFIVHKIKKFQLKLFVKTFIKCKFIHGLLHQNYFLQNLNVKNDYHGA